MTKIAVVGLGYVGLPLAVAFSRHFAVVGFDTDEKKIAIYREGRDPAGQISRADFQSATTLSLSADPGSIADADFLIITVPTPVDAAHQPDFAPLLGASRMVGRHMKAGATVVYESTVYPGATEEKCIPILEAESGMRWREGFNVAYSPERINPGDHEHTLARITKLVAGDTPETLERTAQVYEKIIEAGVYRVASIAVAEAAKVIENTQRDLNIALVNELAIIFNHLQLDTLDVLQAAGTKWNFLPFRPGLVGGHCIGVDPYYLTHKAQMVGYHPQVILAGRQINDGMGKFIAEQTVKRLIQSGDHVRGARVNVLGLAFKEDCPDLRNTRVTSVISELASYGVDVAVHDPVVDPEEARAEFGIELRDWADLPAADAVVLAVPHQAFLERGVDGLRQILCEGGCVVDVKSVLDRETIAAAGLACWRL
ncbi:MAG: nucleotide sugar dehydrogenase [Gammaproteobacteria bacterium]|nr:nucleotide sugar dehydrogenase [Gammaproteobacteria bacterium]